MQTPGSQDPFEDKFEQDPFIDDYFGGQQAQAGHFNQANFQSPDQKIPVPNATGVLVTGILSILFAFCYGVFGLILAIISLGISARGVRMYKENPERFDQTTWSNLKAGRICAFIGLGIGALFLIFFVVVIAIAVNDNGYY